MITENIINSRITSRDNEIVKHIERFKFASFKQIEKMFFPYQAYSKDLIHKRMKVLEQGGYVKHFKTEQGIPGWMLSDKKLAPPSEHRLILLDLYAELIYSGMEVELFEIEKFWQGGNIRSDALCIFTIADRRYHYFVEVNLSNHPANLEKYDKLYQSGEVQKYLNKNFFPRVLFISDRNSLSKDLKNTKVVQINTSLKPFYKLVLM